MGTSLCPVGNHKIRFRKRPFKELTAEILDTLNGSPIPNGEFLMKAALQWENNCSPKASVIRRIKTKREWMLCKWVNHYSFRRDKRLYFSGPYNLDLVFEEYKIEFYNPPYGYWQWFEWKDDAHFNEWRKYFFHIVKLFGGDRVIYLADNAHPLDEFRFYKANFRRMEKSLHQRFGPPKNTFAKVMANYKNSYFIDEFKTLGLIRKEIKL